MIKNHLQRLLPPPGTEAFGGIATFKGMSADTKTELFKIANFDYMGNTEYEFGRIPKSLQKIFTSKSIKSFEQIIAGVSFILIIDEEKKDEYVTKVKDWSKDNYDRGHEYSGLNDIISGVKPSRNVVAWLDIDEHVLFFLNKNEGKIMADQFNMVLTTEV